MKVSTHTKENGEFSIKCTINFYLPQVQEDRLWEDVRKLIHFRRAITCSASRQAAP